MPAAGGVTMPTLTLPEAKQQVTSASAPFMVIASHVFELVRQGERPPSDDASIEVVARLIRSADAYADAITSQSQDGQSRYHDETVMIAGLRRLPRVVSMGCCGKRSGGRFVLPAVRQIPYVLGDLMCAVT
jgi:hypothetical protein